MTPSDSLLRSTLDPEAFKKQCHQLVDQLADYLKTIPQHPVFRYEEPALRKENWKKKTSLEDIFKSYIAESMHLHHPHFMGHQQGFAIPIAAVTELMSAFFNNSSSVFEMGSASVVVEKIVLDWLISKIGFPPTAGGIFTSGGSLGNLTGLLSMRELRSQGESVWKSGLSGRAPLAVMVSSLAHYSIKRAVQITGMGEVGCISVPVDAEFRLDVNQLPKLYQEAEKKGVRVVGVVGSISNTPSGSFDPLEAIADFCAEKKIWLHADGAHGAAAVLSDTYRHLVKGIDRADSVSWDMHKLMLMPGLSTAVIWRREIDGIRTFSQEASYIGAGDPLKDWFNPVSHTFETTRRDMGMRVFVAMKLYGEQIFGDYVTRVFDHARNFATLIKDQPDFELAAEPQSNIVCFRYLKKGVTDLDGFQKKIRDAIYRRGIFYTTQTQLPTGFYLRVTLQNPFYEIDHFKGLLEEIRTVGN